MEKIFKSYDVRGIYPSEINDEIVYRIGRATVKHIGAKKIAIAADNRSSSPALVMALRRGITESGADVVDLGLLSTPMLYFASAKLDVDGAVMVTASHNPKEYNGLKISKKNAVPIGLSTGLAEIRDLVMADNFTTASRVGVISQYDIKPSYDEFLISFADFKGRRFRLATDTAHAMGVFELPVLHQLSGVSLCTTLYDTLRIPGSCPHEANPLRKDTLIELQHAVRQSKADFGIAYDGDADRIGFVDEQGIIVPMDLMTALLSEALLPSHPHATILYDLRSSRSVKETIERSGGVAHECMVGHANIKKQMIEEGALAGGEATGHYYFTFGGYTAEMGTLPAILLMNLLARTGKKLSELVSDVKRYHHSGEMNFDVADPQTMLERVKQCYADGTLSERDGIKIDYPDWWVSLRASNTEPVIRLNLEAVSQELMEEKREEVIALLNQ